MPLYDPFTLYTDAYTINYDWEKWLDTDVYEYHNLLHTETNSPITLQMGILLPFITSCAGPKCFGIWQTDESVLNMYTINVAASGVGKSRTRKRLVSNSIQYMLDHVKDLPDFEVSRFTRAGMYRTINSIVRKLYLTEIEKSLLYIYFQLLFNRN